MCCSCACACDNKQMEAPGVQVDRDESDVGPGRSRTCSLCFPPLPHNRPVRDRGEPCRDVQAPRELSTTFWSANSCTTSWNDGAETWVWPSSPSLCPHAVPLSSSVIRYYAWASRSLSRCCARSSSHPDHLTMFQAQERARELEAQLHAAAQTVSTTSGVVTGITGTCRAQHLCALRGKTAVSAGGAPAYPAAGSRASHR
jgi:hypothetical protein